MTERNPPTERPTSTELVPVSEPLWREPRRFADPYVIQFKTRDTRSALGKLTGRERRVLDALTEIWRPYVRHIETSIRQISRTLEDRPMQESKISEALRVLKEKRLILIDQSRRNDFHIRVNPFIFWKGGVPANKIARSDEAPDWSGWNERIEAR